MYSWILNTSFRCLELAFLDNVEAILYDQFNLTDHVLCKMTDLYFEDDIPLGA